MNTKVTVMFATRDAKGNKVWRIVRVPNSGNADINIQIASMIFRRRYPTAVVEGVR